MGTYNCDWSAYECIDTDKCTNMLSLWRWVEIINCRKQNVAVPVEAGGTRTCRPGGCAGQECGTKAATEARCVKKSEHMVVTTGEGRIY
jgi:hypothetical protein